MFATNSSSSKKDFEIYNGLSDPDDFFRQFNLHCMVHEWDDNKKPLALKLFLSGKAEDLYDVLFASGKTTFKELRDGIVAGCQLSKQHKLTQFYQRKMKSDESVLSYYQALKSLFKKTMDASSNPDDLHFFVHSHLLSNVPLEFRPMLHMASCVSPEAFVKVVTSMNAPSDKVSESLGLAKSEEMQMNALASRPTPNRNLFDGNCHNCGMYGHRIAFCNVPLTRNNNGNSNSRSSRNGSAPNSTSFRGNSEYGSRGGNGGSNNSNTSINGAQYSNKNNNIYPNGNRGGYNANNNNFNNRNSNSATNRSITNQLDASTIDSDQMSSTMADNNNTELLSRSEVKLPFTFADFFTIEMAEINSLSKTNLFIIEAMITADNGSKRNIKVLVDGGSTHSFLSPFVFNTDLSKWSERGSVVDQDFLIRGAIATTQTTCKMVNLNLAIGGYMVSHPFVVSNNVTRYEGVIGRDFLQRHNVTIRHGSNEMVINNTIIKISSVQFETLTNSENSIWNNGIHSLDQQQHEVQQMILEVKSLDERSDELLKN